MVAGHMAVPQFRGPITYCVLQWCHPMLTGTQRRTSCSTRMITLFGDHVIKLDSGPRTYFIKISNIFLIFLILFYIYSIFILYFFMGSSLLMVMGLLPQLRNNYMQQCSRCRTKCETEKSIMQTFHKRSRTSNSINSTNVKKKERN